MNYILEDFEKAVMQFFPEKQAITAISNIIRPLLNIPRDLDDLVGRIKPTHYRKLSKLSTEIMELKFGESVHWLGNLSIIRTENGFDFKNMNKTFPNISLKKKAQKKEDKISSFIKDVVDALYELKIQPESIDDILYKVQEAFNAENRKRIANKKRSIEQMQKLSVLLPEKEPK